MWGNRHKYSFSTRKIKKRIINGAKDFTEYANKIINGTSCLYLTENETIAESQDINTSWKIPKRLKVYKVLRNYNKDNVYQMEFYELANKTDPFHIHLYCH